MLVLILLNFYYSLQFLSNQTTNKSTKIIGTTFFLNKKEEEENYEPPGKRHRMVEFEHDQKREGEEQTMGDQSVQRLGDSRPRHHSPMNQHSQNNTALSLSLFLRLWKAQLQEPWEGELQRREKEEEDELFDHV